jgi:hypothetical protein
MKFHHIHKSVGGHDVAINGTGTAIQFTFAQDFKLVTVTIAGEDAKSIREALMAAELRTQAEADALGQPPAEVNPGIKVEMEDQTIDANGDGRGDGTFRFAQTPDELAQLQAIAATNRKAAQALIAQRKAGGKAGGQ